MSRIFIVLFLLIHFDASFWWWALAALLGTWSFFLAVNRG